MSKETQENAPQNEKKGLIKSVVSFYSPSKLVKNAYSGTVQHTIKPAIIVARRPFYYFKYVILPTIMSINPRSIKNLANYKNINISWHLLSIYGSLFVLFTSAGLIFHLLWFMDIPIVALLFFALYGAPKNNS
jgi:hypothetical protein